MKLYGKGRSDYKGVEFELNGYGGFNIFFESGTYSFQPYAGNKLFNLDCIEIEKRLIRRIKYRINKEVKQ